MNKTSLIILLGALIAFIILPSNKSTAQQKKGTEKVQVAEPDHWTVNLANTLLAYNEESYASAKYAAYSEQAQNEGKYEIALLFTALSKASAIHAKNHKAILAEAGENIPEVKPKIKVNSTKENLRRALAYENEQITNMYPLFVIDANRAQHQPSQKSMNFAYLTSHKYKALIQKAIDAMESNDMELMASTYFLCPECGNLYEHEVHPFCQFCEEPINNYIRISAYKS